MEKYEQWMKTWRKWKQEWIESPEKINCFVVHAVPPGKSYSTRKHYELSVTISDTCGYPTHINTREKYISVDDGTHVKPSILFHTERANRNYPSYTTPGGEMGMAVANMKTSDTELDVLDNFGFVSYRLTDFTRVDILKVVKSMEHMGFGVLHDGGIVGSSEDDTGTPSVRFRSKLPHRDDPTWLIVDETR